MQIALDKNHKKVHIDDAIRSEKYYCQGCGEEVCMKTGDIKIHHFSHMSNTNCDSWHYDMTEWHKAWQNQFPIENQEVVFELEGKKHRADVFINDTVIEFQHSPLSCEEFNDRNEFYNRLGYRVIWIFDATEEYATKEIEKHNNSGYMWKKYFKVFRNLKQVDKKVDIYLQEYENIWKEQPNYAKSIINIYDTNKYAHLHHVDWTNGKGLEYFRSNCENMLFDFEIINNYIPISFMNNSNLNIEDLKLLKKEFNTNDLSDFLNSEEVLSYGREYKYVWCPAAKKYVYSGEACHACQHLSQNYDRCKYRFEKLLSKQFDKILDIKYSNEGKVEYVIVIKDNNRYKINYDSIPTESFTLLEVFKIFPQASLIGVKNVNTGWCVLLDSHDYERMLKYGECYGRMRSPFRYSGKYEKSKNQIFNWNKNEWNVVWVNRR